jgi:threonine/homoserine/homoserine lactone efflux protein
MLAVLMGFAFGYLGSMPVAGPISVLVLHLGLTHHPRHGLWVAVGGALAESGYALLAFWGLSAVLARYPMILPAARVVGAVLLLGLGLAMLLMRAPAAAPPPQPQSRGQKRSFVLGFLITALNPTLIVTWTAAVAALNSTGLLVMDRSTALPFAAAVGTGIIAWFLTLLWLAGKWRERVSGAGLARLLRGTGAFLAALGGWMGVRALLRLAGV